MKRKKLSRPPCGIVRANSSSLQPSKLDTPEIHIEPGLDITITPVTKLSSAHTFTIVAAVYNVEQYLGDFFSSIVAQTIDFNKYIEIILVDDGSEDSSAHIIAEWIDKYPQNIRYIYQDNAGQAEARNTGIEYAKFEWITFIDPDDFLSENYFEAIDSLITKSAANHKKLEMVSANLVLFMEESGEFKDTHPLRYRFAKGECVLPASNPGKHIQLSASTAVFNRYRINERNLRFNAEIRPAFEDGHFVNRYLLGISDGYIAFTPAPIYYYRKRGDGTSTLDTAWEKPGRFDAQLRLGYKDLMDESLRLHGYVKDFIQRVVLYDLSWHFKRFIDNDKLLSHLSVESRSNYIGLVKDLMSNISTETILNFELAGIWFYHKLGILSYFKGFDPHFAITYIDEYDALKDLVKIRYFTHDSMGAEHFAWDGTPTLPAYSKTREHTLYGSTFVYERIVWLKVGTSTTLTAVVGKKADTRITLRGKQHKHGVEARAIRSAFNLHELNTSTFPQEVLDLRAEAVLPANRQRYGGAWLLMDRDTQADDNAEHLYRYVKDNHPKQKIFFILNRDAADWSRLEADDFNLIEFNSADHKIALLNCKHLISSHADQYVFGGLPRKQFSDLIRYKYTFLQHGVIKDDLSPWLNAKPIDCFITTTKAEYNSICNDGPYKFTGKEVILSGLPRHDKLKSLRSKPDRTILIMPTWRHNLVGSIKGLGNERELNPDFIETDFFLHWNSILHSQKLRDLCVIHNYNVVFFPHANIQAYLSLFDIPEHIEVGTHKSGASIQEYFARASIMVTDYSSVAFEMAALKRAVVYYQFDHETMFSGAHIYRPGYFDYIRDGFGPVCFNEDTLLDALEQRLQSHGVPGDMYVNRMEAAFGDNAVSSCSKIYEAIDALERNRISEESSIPAVRDAVIRSLKNHDWHLSVFASRKLIELDPLDQSEHQLSLARALRGAGNFSESANVLALVSERTLGSANLLVEEHLELAVATLNFELVRNLLNKKSDLDDLQLNERSLSLLAKCHRLSNDIASASAILQLAADPNHRDVIFEKAEIATQTEAWPEALDIWHYLVNACPSEHCFFRVAEASRHLGLKQEALAAITTIQVGQFDGYHREAALIFFCNGKWRDAIRHLLDESKLTRLSSDLFLVLSKSYRKIGNVSEAKLAYTEATGASDERLFLQESAFLYMAAGEWSAAVNAWKGFIARKDLRPNRDALIDLARSRYKAGDIANSLKDLQEFEKKFGENARSIELRSELCELKPHLKLA